MEKNSTSRAKEQQPDLEKAKKTAQDRERWRLVVKALCSRGNEEEYVKSHISIKKLFQSNRSISTSSDRTTNAGLKWQFFFYHASRHFTLLVPKAVPGVNKHQLITLSSSTFCLQIHSTFHQWKVVEFNCARCPVYNSETANCGCVIQKLIKMYNYASLQKRR